MLSIQSKINEIHLNEKIQFGLYGAGGCARGVMPFVRHNLMQVNLAPYNDRVSVKFIETNPSREFVNGYPLVSEDNFFSENSDKKLFNVAIANSQARKLIAERCISKGALPKSLFAPNFICYDENSIGEGGIFCAHSMVTSNVKIGKFFHLNIYSYVEHDCVVGDWVTFAPGVRCNGYVHIHDHAYIGAGAMIKQGSEGEPIVIGQGAVVGMGAVVTRSVEAFSTVVGNPARKLKL